MRNSMDGDAGTAVLAGPVQNFSVAAHNDRRGVLALTVVAVALIAALVLVARPGEPAAISGSSAPGSPPVVAASTTPVSTTPTSVPAPAGSAEAAREVRLDRDTGIDVESGEVRGRRAAAVHGNLRLTTTGLLYAGEGGFRRDSGPESGALSRCARALADDVGAEEGVLLASPGEQRCFRTATGRTAWLRTEVSNLTSFTDGYLVLTVLVG